jgi:uncharacterized protein (DUF1697 family)
MSEWVALLRGINVGGKNLIKMADLKTCFEAGGFSRVATYIQSGNVLFTAAGSSAALCRRIEATLGKTFGYRASVVLRTRTQLESVVEDAPAGFGRQPAKFRYDVIFLKEPLTAVAALESVRTRDGIDQAYAGDGVLYFSRLIARASQSQLARITGMPVYQHMTIRNWNTTTKLLQLMEAMDG